MSPVIDQRVVEMGFDNARFEKNVHTSISTLDKLKAALNLDGATKGISNVESAFNKLNLGNVSSAVDKIADRFSAMGIIGMRVLENLTDKAMELGKKLMDFAVLEPMSAGWTKYADKTTAVQTIMAATQDTWEESAEAMGFVGDQMEFVNSQMDKLNWFTDETSYNFVDMVSNIGKFTSNQIPLEQAVTAMQGIANWAAVSGQNAGSASRAMYNLAQAIGVGSVKLMDWRSIENANMATAEFKQKVLEVAAAQGQLKEVSEGVYETLAGHEVTVKSFSKNLADNWFTSDVLLETLDQYGAVTDALYKFSEASGLTATDILGLVEKNKKLVLSDEELSKISEETGMSLEDLRAGINILSSEAAEFGIKVFKAAQEAKTFQDAIDATKDAASTTWMKIYENIFGDYEKARHIWTGFANFLYDELVGPLERLVDISEMLGNLSAVERLASSFMDVLTYIRGDGEEVLGILGNIRAGFEEIFEPLDDTEIYAMLGGAISAIREFSMGLEVTSEQAERLQSIGRLLGNALEYVMNSVKNLWSATEPLRDAIGDIGGKVQTIIDRFLQLHSSFDTSGVSGGVLASVCQTLADVLGTLSGRLDSPTVAVEKLVTAFHGLQNILSFIGNTFANLFSAMKPIGDALINVGGAIADLVVDVFGLASDMDTAGASSKTFAVICQSLADFINLVADAIKKANFDGLKEKFSGFGSLLGVLDGLFSSFLSGISGFATTMKDTVGKAVDWVKEKFEALKQTLTGFDWNGAFKGGLTALLGGLFAKGLFDWDKASKANPLSQIMKLPKMLNGVLKEVKWTLEAFQLDLKVDALKKLASALLMLSGALLVLGFVNYDNAVTGIMILGGALAILFMNLDTLKAIDTEKLAKLSGTLLAIAAALLIAAVAMGIMAGAVALFALVAKMDTAWDGFAMMIATLAASVLILAGAAKFLEGMAGEVLAVASALLVAAAAMLVFALALGAFVLILKLAGQTDTLIAAGVMLGTFAVVLGVLVVAVKVLGEQTPMMLAAAGALLIAAAAILVMAVSLGALMAVIKLVGETAALEALISLGALLIVVTAALLLLANAGPLVLAGAGSLLVAAAALLVLAAAVGVAAVAMLILGPALTAFGAGIKNFVVDIGEAIAGFFTSISEMLPTLGNGIKELVVSIAEGIGESVAALGTGIGEAVSALGTGIGEAVAALGDGVGDAIAGVAQGIADAIADLIASIGEGIGQGLSAISTGLSDISTGISDFGESVRSLSGISWTATALGIGELALALNKLNKKDLAGNLDGIASSFQAMITTITTSLGDASSQTESGGQQLIQSMITGMDSKNGEVQISVTALMTTGKNAIEATYGDWQNDGSQLIIVVIAGMQSQSGALASAGTEISNTGSSAVMSTQGTWEYAGQMLGQGLANGLWSMLGEVQAAASALASAAAEGVEATAQINSPSKVATWEGEQYGEGMVIGLESKIGDVKSTTSQMISGLGKALANARGRISSALEAGFTPTIRPVLDLSNVMAYAGSIPDLNTSVGTSRVGVIARRQNAATNQNGSEIRGGDINNITNTVNIHTQPGQNAEEIADAVERRLAFKQKQRQVAHVR